MYCVQLLVECGKLPMSGVCYKKIAVPLPSDESHEFTVVVVDSSVMLALLYQLMTYETLRLGDV